MKVNLKQYQLIFKNQKINVLVPDVNIFNHYFYDNYGSLFCNGNFIKFLFLIFDYLSNATNTIIYVPKISNHTLNIDERYVSIPIFIGHLNVTHSNQELRKLIQQLKYKNYSNLTWQEVNIVNDALDEYDWRKYAHRDKKDILYTNIKNNTLSLFAKQNVYKDLYRYMLQLFYNMDSRYFDHGYPHAHLDHFSARHNDLDLTITCFEL